MSHKENRSIQNSSFGPSFQANEGFGETKQNLGRESDDTFYQTVLILDRIFLTEKNEGYEKFIR